MVIKLVQMKVVFKQKKPAHARRVKDCISVFKNDYNIKFGVRQILKVLRLTDVIDENNNIKEKYQSMGLFKHQAIGIETNVGKLVNSYRTLFLTEKGIVFVGKHLQQYPNISLSRNFSEYLMKYILTVVKKEVCND